MQGRGEIMRDGILRKGIYCILGESFSRGRSNIDVAREMIEADIKIIQYREKEKKALYKFRECMRISEMAKAAGVLFIVNDDLDIALAVDADGVHIGQEDLPIEVVRRLAGENMIIGLSTHSPEQGRDAVVRGADYIGVGPIFRTFTKKDVCDPVGLEYLDFVVRNLDIPFVAIGGIKESNIAEVIEHGATCICLVTDILESEDIKGKIRFLQEKMVADR